MRVTTGGRTGGGSIAGQRVNAGQRRYNNNKDLIIISKRFECHFIAVRLSEAPRVVGSLRRVVGIRDIAYSRRLIGTYGIYDRLTSRYEKRSRSRRRRGKRGEENTNNNAAQWGPVTLLAHR